MQSKKQCSFCAVGNLLPVCVSCLCHKLRELTSIYGCLQGISTSTTLFTKEKKSIPSGCKQNYNPNNSGGVETIACRRPKQKQLLWALIPQLIF